MIRKIGILILIGIISMYTVIPIALADDNDNPNVNDEIIVKDEGENIFKLIWDKLTSMLSFFENEKETTVNVEEEHPGGKVNHGAIVSTITKIINKLESVVGKAHGMIVRAVAKTNWGKQIKEKDSLDDNGDTEENGVEPTDTPPKKSIGVLEAVFNRILENFEKQRKILDEVLEKVLGRVPDKAKLGIERAIENNKRKIERMERVKNRNSNNE